LGVTIAAVSYLPLKDSRFIYGTKDAGKTIFDGKEDNHFLSLVSEIANYFGFSEHIVVDSNAINHSLVLAADVEIHKDKENYYMLDFGRFLPPNNPKEPFIHQFRSEYLTSRSLNISCDAFTGFGSYNKSMFNAQAEKVIEEFENYVRHEFTRTFPPDLTIYDIQYHFHKHGVNLRYMGIVRTFLPDRDSKLSSILLMEMILRSLRTILQIKLAHAVTKNFEPAEFVYQQYCYDFYQKLLNEYPDIWNGLDSNQSVKRVIMAKYTRNSLFENEIDNNFPIHSKTDKDLLKQLLPIYLRFEGGSILHETKLIVHTKNILKSNLFFARVEKMNDEAFAENFVTLFHQSLQETDSNIFIFFKRGISILDVKGLRQELTDHMIKNNTFFFFFFF